MSDLLPIFRRAFDHGDRLAIVDSTGRHTYQTLLDASAAFAARLLDGSGDLAEQRIAFLVPPGFSHVAAQWGIWRAGGVAVPLCLSHPARELAYVLDDTQATTIVARQDLTDRISGLAQERGLRLLALDEMTDGAAAGLPALESSRRATILYTSGTTSKPKGVVATHANVQAQVEALVEAWEWSSGDHILHVLPLHHVHGIINVLTCALWSGAACEMLPKFDPAEVWQTFARGDLTLFMAVPTIYSKLIAHWEQASTRQQQAWTASCQSMRLMVSGSAALPVSTLEKWRSISGHTLLERYGMTEIGMALSNPLHGERIPGHVGTPLPGVEVRRLDEQGQPAAPDTAAELEVRGPAVFSEYWNKPDATQAGFRDGWFRTGDVMVVEEGAYRILGRNSVDIIKTGGYKVSALEVEEILRQHPDIQECAVVGVEDDEWGQRVAACVVLREDGELTLDALRAWSKEQMAPYKTPTLMLPVDGLPRNTMGKVQKPAIVNLFRAADSSAEEAANSEGSA